MNRTYKILFSSREEMVWAATSLLLCHAHHFNIRPDNGFALESVSTTGLSCLDVLESPGVVVIPERAL